MGLFYICLVVLIGGFFIYGGYVENCFQPPIDDRKTPAYRLEDDVDYVPMSTPRVFLIQLLNIAGLGPIFGAISGALWGPLYFCGLRLVLFLPGLFTIFVPACCLSAIMVPVLLKLLVNIVEILLNS